MAIYLVVDLACVIISYFLLNSRKSLTFFHPGTMLLFYHILNNTFRYFTIIGGAKVAFADYNFFDGPSIEELQRALFWSDIGLLSASVAIFIADRSRAPVIKTLLPLNRPILKWVCIVAIPIGIWAALNMLYIPNFNENLADFGEWSASSYLLITQSWFGLALCALIYFNGFKKKYVIPLVIYLLIIALQGGLRFRLILPVIFLVTSYLFTNGLKWPTRPQFIALICCGILFYPLKVIGQIVREGGSISDIPAAISATLSSFTEGNATDQVFLDQYAMTLTEVDRNGKVYYGSTFMTIFTLAIPRQLWEDKPAINQWQVDISSASRPFSHVGAIATIYGESYANFRYLGIILVPGVLFYILTRWYRKIIRLPFWDVDKFFYALIFCCLIQVLRDGVLSLFVFPVLNSMPLFAVFLLHKIFGKRIKPDQTSKALG